MFDSVINYFDKFGPELLIIQVGFLVIVSTLFLWLWFSNRKKYQNLRHVIPANVVKSYLDSIIQNSTALKSQLFRGGGLDVDGAVPSVMPLQHMVGGDSMAMSGSPNTALLEELNQKKAHIAFLESQLSSGQGSGKELEGKLAQSQKNLSSAEAKIKELEAKLKASASAPSSGGGDAAASQAEIAQLTKERDELQDRLKEFEIISDDLANLKRLQQENEQLRRSLSAQGASVPERAAPQAAPAPAKTAAEKDEEAMLSSPAMDLEIDNDVAPSESSGDEVQAFEEFLSASGEEEAPSETSEPAMEESSPMEVIDESPVEEIAEIEAAAESKEEDNKPKSDKTPEDLLSEFEKMLG